MNTKIFSILFSVAAMAGFSACDSWDPEKEVNQKGQLNTTGIGVEVDGVESSVNDNAGALKVKTNASRATVDLSHFIITVNNSNGEQVSRWTYANMPDLPTFPVGDYTISVKSHEVEPAAWNAPYFEGSKTFSIVADKITDVETIVCTLANIRVTVYFSDKLKQAIDNLDEAYVKITSEGNNSLIYTPTETRSGYFAALDDLETLRLDFSASVKGQEIGFTKTLDYIAKGQHRKIYLSLTSNDNLPPEELGTITNDGEAITIDNTVSEDDPIESDYPWYEDNLDGSGRPGGEDFDDNKGDDDDPPTPPSDYEISFNSETLNLSGVNMVSDYGVGIKDAIVVITSTKEFSSLLVKIESNMLTDDFLMPVGLISEFDLANPPTYVYDGETKDTTDGLKGLGFPVKDEVTGAGITSIDFDITQFVPLILESGDHKFHITVTDKEGHSNSMTLLLRK